MRDDVIHHQNWLSEGRLARGKVMGHRVSNQALIRKFDKPSIDNSIADAGYANLCVSKEDKAAQWTKNATARFITAGTFKDGRRKITHQIGHSAIQIDINNSPAPKPWRPP